MTSLRLNDATAPTRAAIGIDGLVSLEIREAPEAVSRPNESVNLHWIGDASLEQPSWLIKKILPQKGVALLSGQFSSGKTFIEIDIALAVGLDVPFMGRRVKQGGVLWIAAEGSGEIEHRVEAARRGKYDSGLGDRYAAPFAWTDEAPPLGTDQGFKWLEDACVKADKTMRANFGIPLRLVPIDTLAAAFGLEDENDNAAAAALMKRLGDLGNKHNILMMPIAHLGKNAEAGTRGASAFGAGADAVLSVLANGDPLKGAVSSRSLVLSKSRRGATGPLGFFELEEVELGRDEDGDAVTSCCVRFVENDGAVGQQPQPLGKGESLFLDSLDESLAEAGREHRPMGDGPTVKAVSLQTVQNRFGLRYVTGEQAAKQGNAKRQAWKRALESLQSKRIIACDNVTSTELVWRL